MAPMKMLEYPHFKKKYELKDKLTDADFKRFLV